MTTWMDGIFSRGGGAMAEKVAAFAEARNAVLADNIANIDTAGYKTKDLSVAEFQQTLAAAIDESQETGGPLALKTTRHIQVDSSGAVSYEPVETQDNILFHDHGDRSIEKEMSELAKNQMLYQVAISVLQKQNGTLAAAIAGHL